MKLYNSQIFDSNMKKVYILQTKKSSRNNFILRKSIPHPHQIPRWAIRNVSDPCSVLTVIMATTADKKQRSLKKEHGGIGHWIFSIKIIYR
jgi:hypothetical protein